VLLIHGGSGVVGSIATQLAVARGATVIATTGDLNANFVASLGATPVRYGPGLVQRVHQISPRVDAVLDAAGLGGLADMVTLRGGTERIVTFADPAAFDMGITFDPDNLAAKISACSPSSPTWWWPVRCESAIPVATR
jgi:NADPH:quinone reductase-like Zn-dependent oxidoreductase